MWLIDDCGYIVIIVDNGIQDFHPGGCNEGCCHEGNLRRCWVGFTFFLAFTFTHSHFTFLAFTFTSSAADTSTKGSKSVLEEPKIQVLVGQHLGWSQVHSD